MGVFNLESTFGVTLLGVNLIEWRCLAIWLGSSDENDLDFNMKMILRCNRNTRRSSIYRIIRTTHSTFLSHSYSRSRRDFSVQSWILTKKEKQRRRRERKRNNQKIPKSKWEIYL